jgi:hypothetical protein
VLEVSGGRLNLLDHAERELTLHQSAGHQVSFQQLPAHLKQIPAAK